MNTRWGYLVAVLLATTGAVGCTGSGDRPTLGTGAARGAADAAGTVGPRLHDDANPNGGADHWHAAFGVNLCGRWVPGPLWPQFGPDGTTRTRHDEPSVYAGLHTHELADGTSDSVIHMEPNQADEAGRNATLGRFMAFGGWRVSATALTIWRTVGPLAPTVFPSKAKQPTETHRRGDVCSGEAGTVRWAVGTWRPGQRTRLVEQHGDPSALKLLDEQVIAIYFVPASARLAAFGPVPSERNLPNRAPSSGPIGATTSTLPRT